MAEHSVVVAGGGPTGLMLAAELKLAGVDVVVVERRRSQDLDGSRAGGLHSRTIEILDQRGVAQRFLDAGTTHPFVGYAQNFLDIADFPTRHNYLLGLWQKDFERVLAEWVESELGVQLLREAEVTKFTESVDAIDVSLSTDQVISALYLVGCDGGRSLVRKTAGIDFAGFDASVSWLIAETEMADEPQVGMRPGGGGIGPIDPSTPGGPYRVVLVELEARHATEPDLAHLSATLNDAYGTDFGVHDPIWISRFTDMSRQAVAYRKGRVLLAGDAAHIHAPTGGQGLNTGVQDAFNLGWKLAQVVKGHSPDSLLDTYHDERHPVAARVLHNTMAQVALLGPDERHQALRETMAELLKMDEPRRKIVGMITALDIHYDFGSTAEAHPLIGRRMPDLDLQIGGEETRVFELLRPARSLLLILDGGSFDESMFTNRLDVMTASAEPVCELPIIGEVEVPASILIRPDGHVAWAGSLSDPRLAEAIEKWCGIP